MEFCGGCEKYIKKEVKISILLSTHLNIPTGKENIKLNYWSPEDQIIVGRIFSFSKRTDGA